jgi:hypothetical protein
MLVTTSVILILYTLFYNITSTANSHRLCLRSEDAFVITCVANLMEIKVLFVQQDLRYEVSSYLRFSV